MGYFAAMTWVERGPRLPVLLSMDIILQDGGQTFTGPSGRVDLEQDKGLTWALTSSLPGAFYGPYFGTNEKTMVVVDNNGGIHKTVDGGLTWRLVVTHPINKNPLGLWNYFSWDPGRNYYFYGTSRGPVYR